MRPRLPRDTFARRRSAARSLAACVTLACVVAGCATSRHPLDRASLLASRPKTIQLVVETTDKVSGASGPAERTPFFPPGLIGGVAAIAAVQEAQEKAERVFFRDKGLEDPTRAIAEHLAEGLVADYALARLETATSRQTARWAKKASDDWQAAPKTPSGGPRPPDLVLEVLTTEMSLEPGPTGWQGLRLRNRNRAGLRYELQVRLVDQRSDQVLASGSCEVRDVRFAAARNARSRDEADALLAPAPTAHDFVALDGQRLVAELDLAGDRCERDLRARLLALGPPPPPPSNAAPVPAPLGEEQTDGE